MSYPGLVRGATRPRRDGDAVPRTLPEARIRMREADGGSYGARAPRSTHRALAAGHATQVEATARLATGRARSCKYTFIMLLLYVAFPGVSPEILFTTYYCYMTEIVTRNEKT